MRLYRLFLLVFPAAFRAEYGEEMCAIFARRCRDASNLGSRFCVLVRAVLNVLVDAAKLHIDIIRLDLRYATRSIARSRGFALTAIAISAVGIGANTAVFSVADHVLLRQLPFDDSDRLVNVWQSEPQSSRSDVSPANYRDWKREASSFESLAAFRGLSVNLVGHGEPLRVDGASVTSDLLPMLGIPPLRGRLFSTDDDRSDAPGTVLLSFGLWRSAFAEDPEVIGKSILLDGAAYTVIGVMPAQFYFPNREARLWTAMRFASPDFQNRQNRFLHVVGKLRDSVSIAQVRMQMGAITGRLKREYPNESDTGAYVASLRDEISPQTRLLLLALFGAALSVLLIVCANVANLQLSRALSRRKELTVRIALGAGNERIVRQLMVESMLLAAAGAVFGILIAFTILPLLVQLVPQSLPIAEIPSVNTRTLGFAILLTALTGLAFGSFTSFRLGREADLAALRDRSRFARGSDLFRSVLVVTEVSVSVALLIASGLLVRALFRIQEVDPGFKVQDVVTLRTVLPMPKYEMTASRTLFYSRVLDQVRALPEVKAAAYTSFLPLVLRGGSWPVEIDGRGWKPSESHSATLRFITPGYFNVMRIPVRAGRDFSDSDTADALFVAVVSESFVHHYWRGQDPIGRRFRFGSDERTIVGVVGDVRVSGLERNSDPQVYLPYKQVLDGAMTWFAPKDLVVQTASVLSIVPSIRRVVHDVDPELPISDVRTLSEIVEQETAPRRVQVRVLGAFAAVAFLLAGIGIHGVLSVNVSTRSNEIGVRTALGATSADILIMILRESARLASIGILLGVALGYAAGRSLQSLLAGVAPDDFAIFASAAGLAAITVLLGSVVPAIRAIGVDPITAMYLDA